MSLEVGAVYEGKVTGIMKFGAFVALPERKSGLVHISEIANAYVADVNDFLQVGQLVKVRVLNITEDGKINLSIKQAGDNVPPPPERRERPPRPAGDRPFSHERPSYSQGPRQEGRPRQQDGPRQERPYPERSAQPIRERSAQPPRGQVAGPSDDQSFEDKLKRFMQDSDSRIAENKIYADHRERNKRRR